MGNSTLMALGTRALSASYAQLQTTGNNIANANTPGYSRQETTLVTAGGQYTGGGFFGRGVDVSTVTRSYDRFLTGQAAVTASAAASDKTRLEQLTLLENAFPLGEAGIGYAAGEMLNAFVDIANNPQDASARAVALTRARELAARFQSAGNQVSAIQSGVTEDLKLAVRSVNAMTGQIAALNKQIAALNGAGHAPNDLLDQRDLLVQKISEQIGVTTVQSPDGSVGVFVGGGQCLVLGATANQLSTITDPFDPNKLQLAMREGGKDQFVPEGAIAGGAIAGLLSFQNNDLVDARNLLGQLAVAVSSAVNEQQSLGLDLGTPASFGSPLFSVGAPRVLPAFSNRGNATLSLTVSDGAQVQASDYELSYDGASFALTRKSDGQPMRGSPYSLAQLTSAAGVQVDGMTIRLAGGAPAAGDRFRLEPVGAAAQDMKTVLTDPSGLAAASPVTASLGTGNTGSASVASVRAVDASLDRTLTANISFTSDTGGYSWELRDASNTLVGSGTGAWSAGSPIALNGFELQLDGVPRNGDTVSVSPTVDVASNNGNAHAFIDLATLGLVNAQTLADGTVVPGRTITDAFASAVAEVGVRVQSATTASQISSSVATAAEAARADKSGVNLDEEAAKLIQYQQSYQAAAKMLQVAQTVFETLLRQAGI